MKIAVIINGSGKYLDLTNSLFAEWNNLYSNVSFDFYLATWEDDIDYSKYSWIKKFIRLKEEDCPYDLKKHPARRHQPHYSYTLYKANELIKEDYDAVIQTRSDFYMFREVLDYFVDLYKDKQVGENIIYSYAGTSLHNGHLWTDDMFFYGSQNTFNKFSSMFEDVFINKIFPEEKIMMHIMQAEYLNYQKIYNRSIWPVKYQGLLIREPMRFDPDGTHTDAGWPLKHPSPNQFKFILAESGPRWMLTKDNELKARRFFETTKKI